MKTDIHPKYVEATITCACGEVVKTRSTVEEMRVEICSKCHPIFTGKHKMIDTEGIVDKFKARIQAADKIKEETGDKKKKERRKKQKASLDIKQIMADQEERRRVREEGKKKEADKKLKEEMKEVKVRKASKEEIAEVEEKADKVVKKIKTAKKSDEPKKDK